ncbi:MAG TPA: FliM/FliN family flagellar motor switch protein [Polyangiaceae bacterium]|nr:FliM/FliN family flagellar motor switch protein [Polyangiaceae bacterium]
MQVTSFRWQSLPKVSGADCAAQKNLRHLLRHFFDLTAAVKAAGEILADTVEVKLTSSGLARPPATQYRVLLADPDQRTFLIIDAEPDLAAAAIARLLSRPLALEKPGIGLDPALWGALSALVLELVRRSAIRSPFLVATQSPQALPQQGLQLTLAAKLNGRLHALKLWFASLSDAAPVARAPARSDYDPQLMLSVPLVVAQGATEAGQLAALSPNDTWLSREGWWINGHFSGKGVLCAPGSEVGIAVDITPKGVVIGKTKIALSANAGDNMPNEFSDAVDQTLADLPVIVRAELGSVTLPAAEWAQLQPGDVLPFGSKVGGVVSLRVAGLILAQGELVDVDGELGVRITSVATPKQP